MYSSGDDWKCWRCGCAVVAVAAHVSCLACGHDFCEDCSVDSESCLDCMPDIAPWPYYWKWTGAAEQGAMYGQYES